MGPASAGAAIPLSGADTTEGQPISFDRVYADHVDFVWRVLRRLGVHDVEDAVQDVFVVAHRRLRDFEGRSTLRTWLYGVALRVAREHRRRARGSEALPDDVASEGAGPEGASERAEALRVLDRILSSLGDEKREVFVLAEVAEMTAPEIAEAIGVNLNTVYSRLRLAREEFDEAAKRHQARDAWRMR